MPRTSSVHAVTTIGMDMGKNTLHMIGLDTRGAIVLREKVSRGRIASRLANLPSCLIGIEPRLSPTSWRGSPGLCSDKSAAMKPASPRR